MISKEESTVSVLKRFSFYIIMHFKAAVIAWLYSWHTGVGRHQWNNPAWSAGCVLSLFMVIDFRFPVNCCQAEKCQCREHAEVCLSSWPLWPALRAFLRPFGPLRTSLLSEDNLYVMLLKMGSELYETAQENNYEAISCCSALELSWVFFYW